MSEFKEKVTEIKDKVVKGASDAIDSLKKGANTIYNAIDSAKSDIDDPNYNIKKAILDKIKEYDTIIIHRHVRPDGDAIGTSQGLKALIKNSYPEKKVYVASSDKSDYLSFLPKDDNVAKELYDNALAIVVDTGDEARISNQNYKLAKEIIKIDHHDTSADFGVINYCDPTSASCANLIVNLATTFRYELKLNQDAATCLFVGIVTDSGRFRYASADSRCFKEASKLLEYNIDTQSIYTKLYVEEENKFNLKKYVYSKYKMTPNGVAYIYFKDNFGKKHGNLSKEDITSTINLLDSIKGSMIWILFSEGKESTRVRLRSRYINITELASKYNGGGHENACGSTVYNKKQVKELLKDADTLLKEFKLSHKDLY
ncbi:MAG: bifunctional oligoribonuclease/PAP phosphatase NrnA [Bacilli bacterium]|nr:bifunctional oligoribonuclease/PAP phosphatase NrnA [Bacilli bacterium]